MSAAGTTLPRVPFLGLKEEDICSFAEVLRNPQNTSYEWSQLCLYIVGDINTIKIAILMYHNLIYHQCPIEEQTKQLVRLLQAWDKHYHRLLFLSEVLDLMTLLIAEGKPYLPKRVKPVCKKQTNWENLNQLENINEFLTDEGVFIFTQQTVGEKKIRANATKRTVNNEQK